MNEEITEHERFLMEELSMANDTILRNAYLLEGFIDFLCETDLLAAFKEFQHQKARKKQKEAN